MEKFADQFEKIFKRFLPSPLAIALIITLFTFAITFIWGDTDSRGTLKIIDLLYIWGDSLWTSSLLAFAMQMMLMLVLGHILALTPLAKKIIEAISQRINNPPTAAVVLGSFTMAVAFFNWGLGLIFGAILARNLGESFSKRKIPFNYPLFGAAGYIGLMVWHGGVSGSAPIKAAEPGHISELLPQGAAGLPDLVAMNETVFSAMNGFSTILLFIVIPLTLFLLGKYSKKKIHNLTSETDFPTSKEIIKGAQWFDKKPFFTYVIALVLLLTVLLQIARKADNLQFLTPNFLILLLLLMSIGLHKTLGNFSRALQRAIGDVSGILIQFPLYFGIMGLMSETHIISMLSTHFSEISTTNSFPLFTLLSAGIVNIFVPSGGGQWAIQGPIILETAQELNIPLGKAIMSLAYGDQLTNMLQPFWALPLLGITKLKAKEILPYTLILMLVASVIFITTLLIF